MHCTGVAHVLLVFCACTSHAHHWLCCPCAAVHAQVNRLQKALDLREKGMVYVKGILEG